MLKTPCGGFKLDELSFVLDKETLSTQPVSWDNLINKPFYEESKVVEILPKTTVKPEGSPYGYSTIYGTEVLNLSAGETYIVNYNGTDYECVCVINNSQGFPAFVIGNQVYFDGADTGEPFGFFALSAKYAEQLEKGYVAAFEDGWLDSVTYSIRGEVTTVKTIDPKFIPSGSGGGRYVVPMTIDWETNTITPEIAVSVADLIARLDAGEDVVVKYNIGEKAVICGGYIESVGFASVVSISSMENSETGEKATSLYFALASNAEMPFRQTHILMVTEMEGQFTIMIQQLP